MMTWWMKASMIVFNLLLGIKFIIGRESAALVFSMFDLLFVPIMVVEQISK